MTHRISYNEAKELLQREAGINMKAILQSTDDYGNTIMVFLND